MSDLLFLKPNVVVEPLIDRWFAWSHLVSPATAAMNIKGRHLKIMNSYIQAPQIHAAAVKNPKMKGGPFMDLGGKKIEEVKKLRDFTLVDRKEMIELAEAITELEIMLKYNATGYSLDPLYEKVPEILKGYVELVYDLNNNASFRFFESLLYRSKFYQTASQSIALWITNNDERPFCLSTPKVDDENVLIMNIPFDHDGIDELCKMKRVGGSYDRIKDKLGIKAEEEQLFRSLFTTETPMPYSQYKGDKIRMRYFGHASILIETPQTSILIDPIISYYGYQTDVSRYSDIDLPDEIDYVLITHNHQDHILLESLLPLRHKIKNLVIPRSNNGSLQDPSLRLMFENIGFKNIIEIEEMRKVQFDDCTITGIPFIGEHSDLNIQAKICFHVEIGENSILFVADSCNVEPKLYEHVRNELGDIDVVFLGMECDGAPLTWLYGPLMSEEFPRDKDNSRRLAGSNFERGKSLVDTFNPKEVYVYAMGQEPWLEFISSIKYTPESNPIIASDKLIDYCKNKGLIADRLFGEKELLYEKKSK
ncbi:MBL fold metallo-hydrolase [Flavobacterium sp. WG21]|uniref:MBL fold metallo-hydrolase n=1 Tax=Flavobacterium sp. WG21 TaxID=1229487 RepID=UPI000344A2E2|nr:MBL fold metallo-hydrolase [Flavobacterium sp. WG21]